MHARAKTYYLTNDKSLPVSFHCIMGYEAHNYVSSVTNILQSTSTGIEQTENML